MRPSSTSRSPGKPGILACCLATLRSSLRLAPGELTYRNGNQIKRLAVAWGFVEVLQTRVTILAEAAEKAEEIDTGRAEAAKRKAEAELQKAGLEGNEEAQKALQRAQARLDVAGKSGKQ